MTPAFIRAFDHTVGSEGDFSDDQADRGGRTRFGITEAVARVNGYAGDMRDLPLDTARAIYKAQYWDLLRLDHVALISEPIATELFDTGVNVGIGISGQFLQRALNAFNQQKKDYPDVTADGVVGPMTLAALRAFISKRGREGEAVLLRALNSLQGSRYVEIAEKDATQEKYVYGWFNQRVEI